LKLVPRFGGQLLVNLFVKSKKKNKKWIRFAHKIFHSLTLDHESKVIQSLCSVNLV